MSVVAFTADYDNQWPDRQRQMFADHVIPEPAEFHSLLRSLPFVRPYDFTRWACTYTHSEMSVELISSDRILGFDNQPEDGWDLRDRGEEYVRRFALGIKHGAFDLFNARDLLSVFEIGGVYFVTVNGRHRVAAVKAMIGHPVLLPARVTRQGSVLTVSANDDRGRVRLRGNTLKFSWFLPSDSSFRILEARRKRGLWEGTPDRCQLLKPTVLDKLLGSRVTEASWNVVSSAGPWVFATDLDLAKSAFERTTEK